MTGRPRTILGGPTVALVALFATAAVAITWMAVYQVDDAYIVYRYARHLAEGEGYVFNPGERVEGSTTLLWTTLLAPFAALGLPLPRVAPLLTSACGLAVLWVVMRRHAELHGRVAPATIDLLPASLLLATPGFLYWSAGALETMPYTLLLTLALRDHARERQDTARPSRSALWLSLAVLTRPETPLVVAALALDRLGFAPLRSGWFTRLGSVMRWLAPTVATFLFMLLLRRWYFDDWLPNTWYAKSGAPLDERTLLAWRYVGRWAAQLLPLFGATARLHVWLGLACVAALLVAGLRRTTLRGEALVASALLLAILFEGADWMPLFRFCVPAMPAVVVLASAFGVEVVARYGSARLLGPVLLVLSLTSGLLIAREERDKGTGLAVSALGYEVSHVTIGRYLAARGLPGDAAAMMDIGIIGWLAPQLRVIDITGLTDRAIAHSPGPFLDKRYPVAALLARAPRFMVLVAGYPADDRIARDAAFTAQYVERFRLDHHFNWYPPNPYVMHVYERRP